MRYEKEVKVKLKEIADVLLTYDYEKIEQVGLLGGYAGIMLFLFHYARSSGDEIYQEKALSMIYTSMDIINEGKVDLSYSRGLTGFAWAMEYLAAKEFIDPVQVFSPLHKDISAQMLQSSANGEWDALHGGIGISHYLWYKIEEVSVKNSLEKLVEILADLAIWEGETCKWICTRDELDLPFVDFGLAHGMPGILVFLSKCIQRQLQPVLARKLLKAGIEYILSNKLKDNSENNSYPIFVQAGASTTSKRLAWCYGDPGLLLSFLQINKVLHSLDSEIETLCSAIIQRRGPTENNMFDASLCHGTAGMIPILQILRENKICSTIISEKDLEYWVKQSLKMGMSSDGLAGYRRYAIDKTQVQFTSVPGLLDGITGIAFCFLTYLEREKDWATCLFMY